MDKTKKVETKKSRPAAPHVHPRVDGGNAFFPDPAGGPADAKDDLAQELAEEYVGSATSGEEQHEDQADENP